MLIEQNGDKLSVSADISSEIIKRSEIGKRQRILINEQRTVTNSDGKELVVTVKVATKQYGTQPKAPGYGLTGKKLTENPHRQQS